MKKTLFVATCVAITSLATYSYADDGAALATGAGGAAAGAVVGGPVGAVVGGAIGVVAGAAIDPPPREVVTYVEQQPAPAQRVVVQEEIVVGKRVPDTVVLQAVPENDNYAYAIVNDERVIVDPQTNTVVQVLR